MRKGRAYFPPEIRREKQIKKEQKHKKRLEDLTNYLVGYFYSAHKNGEITINYNLDDLRGKIEPLSNYMDERYHKKNPKPNIHQK